MKAEIVIAGAGVVGASVAWHLAARGVRDIVVVDRAPSLGGGSTAKATGGFRAQFSTDINVRLSLLAREKLRRFEDEIGVDSGYRPYGYLFLARTEDELTQLRAAQGVQHAAGLTEARMIGRDEALSLSPAVCDPTIIGAAFCATDGFLVPMAILRGYTAAAERLGVRFLFGTEVTGLRRQGSRIVAVRTGSGEISTNHAVNAGGAWAAGISNVPVTALRRRVAATVLTDALPPSTPMTIWAGDAFHVRVRDGRILLIWPDTPPDDETWLSEVLRRAHERLPLLRDIALDPHHSWWGWYEMSPDRHIVLGPAAEADNLYLANGSSGHGVMHAPAVGQLVAELIVDGRASAIDIAALRPTRFQEGAAIVSSELL